MTGGVQQARDRSVAGGGSAARSALAGRSVVIAHDFMETFGGAERITQVCAELLPDAPVYTLMGRPSVFRRMGIEDRARSLIPPRERLLRHYRIAAPVLPLLTAAARLPRADLLLTASYGFAHRLRTKNDAPQVCFCYSPLRFAWTMTGAYRSTWARGRVSGLAFGAYAAAMRRSDRRAAQRPALYLAYSSYVADQVERFYGRTPTVVGAPVDCERFRPGDPAGRDEYFLFCGRLIEPYKRVGATIEAFRGLPHRLVIAGDGPDAKQLRARAPANVEFVGSLGDEELVPLMQRCAALVFPSQDDLGLLPLEVMACGRPVLAFAGGGALETVVAGVTGEFFESQDPASIAAAVAKFDPDGYDTSVVREHALRWDRPRFEERFIAALEQMI